jgi:hypothetical protein
MKVTSITFQQTFPTGLYANQKIGIEIEPEEGEYLLGVYDYAKLIVNEAFNRLNPDLNYTPQAADFNTGEPAVVQVEKQGEDQRIGVLVADINSCTELKVLESYKILAKTKPELTDAYNKKYMELIDNP